MITPTFLPAITSTLLVAFVVAGCGAEPAVVAGDRSAMDAADTEMSDVQGDESIASVPLNYLPDGSAAQNERFFLQVLTQAGAGAGRVSASDMTQAVIDAGFSAEGIEVTPDTSLIALPADSVTLAIPIGDDCLIGQWAKDWVVTQVTPLLSTGVCLVGEVDSLD